MVNNAQWENQEAFDLMMREPQVRARMGLSVQLGQPDGHFYAVEAPNTSSASQ